MKIGMVTDSLGHLGFDAMLDTAATLGIQGVEFNACNWTYAPHMNLAELLKSAPARAEFLAAIEDRSLEVIAFNANGNQLHPTGGV